MTAEDYSLTSVCIMACKKINKYKIKVCKDVSLWPPWLKSDFHTVLKLQLSQGKNF